MHYCTGPYWSLNARLYPPHPLVGKMYGKCNRTKNTKNAENQIYIRWKYIDHLPEKSQLTSEAQGEVPSQTQLNKLTIVHPGVGAEASAAAAYINNNDNVYLVQDMSDKWRVVGCERWQTKSTVAQDLGQGPTGTASTTISVEATDETPAPFYKGKIETEDGDFMADGSEVPGE